MAKLVNKEQRVVTGVQNPESIYSRALALELHVPAGSGLEAYCYTPQLGNRLVLYQIDVWAYCADPPAMIGGFFWIRFGTAEPSAAGEIATQWTEIVPVSCAAKRAFRWFECDAFHRCFSMKKLFTADGLRFGVTIQNGYNQAWEACVAFEISEG